MSTPHGGKPGGLVRPFLVAMLLARLMDPLHAADELVRRQKSFIRELYERRDYFNCIAETRRLLNTAPGLAERDAYLYFIEANYFLAGQYRTVIENSKSKAVTGENLPYILLASTASGRIGRYDAGMGILEALDPATLGADDRCRLLAAKSRLFVEAGLFERAYEELRRGAEYESCARLAGLGEALAGYGELPRRSGILAAILSAILPGAGQVYAGRYADGAVSLISVGALATGAFLCFHHRERALGGTLAVAASLVYAGNVYGACNAAKRFNSVRAEGFRARLLERHIPAFDPMEGVDLDQLTR